MVSLMVWDNTSSIHSRIIPSIHHTSTQLPTHLFIHPPIHPTIHSPPVRPSVRPSTRPSIHSSCNAAMRNIDPDCNLFNFSNTRYYLEDDINEIIKRNNLSENEFSLMHLNIRRLPKNIGKLCDFLSLTDNKFTIIGLSETWLHSDNVDL